ncbi:MAG TPA: hypothetical protein VG839_09385 [Asticcacaulis sp.]|nr:hypothetical protein [Asticcacaulis sp.]
MAFETSRPNNSIEGYRVRWSGRSWGWIILGVAIVAPVVAVIAGTAANLHRNQTTITVASVQVILPADSIMPEERELPNRYLVKSIDGQEFVLENAIIWGVTDHVDSNGIAKFLKPTRSYRIQTFGWAPRRTIYHVEPAE